MKQHFWVAFAFILIAGYSCGLIKHKEDAEIALEICQEIGAKNCTLIFSESSTKDQLTGHESETKKTIKLSVNDCKMLKLGWDKDLLASYCANQLYKRLSEETIEGNSGYEIYFDGLDNPEIGNTYFFSNEMIVNSTVALLNLDGFLKEVYANNTSNHLQFYDTSVLHVIPADIDKFTLSLKDSIPNIDNVMYLYRVDKYNDGNYYLDIRAIIAGIDGWSMTANFVSKFYDDFKLVN